MKKVKLINSVMYISKRWKDITKMVGANSKSCTNAVGIISNQSSNQELPRFVCCTNKRACELTAEELQQIKQCCKKLLPKLEIDALCHTDIPTGRNNLLGDAWIEITPARKRKRRKK